VSKQIEPQHGAVSDGRCAWRGHAGSRLRACRGIVTIVILGLLIVGGDGSYLGVLWLIIVGFTSAGYALSSRRPRQPIGRSQAPSPSRAYAVLDTGRHKPELR